MRPALVLFAALLVACGSPAAALPPAAPPPPHVMKAASASLDLAPGDEELSMEVIELMCSPCAAQIVGRSRQLPGVVHVSMVLATKTLTLQFDPTVIGRESVIASVEQIVASIQ